jgi:hypothetical protein
VAAIARESGSGGMLGGQREGEVQVTVSEARWPQPPPTPLRRSGGSGDLGVYDASDDARGWEWRRRCAGGRGEW